MAASAPVRSLVVASRLPFPLDDGWKVRTFHVIRGVARCGPTTLVAYHPDQDADAVAALRDAAGADVAVVTVPPPALYTPRNLIRGLLTRDPITVWNASSPQLHRAIERISGEVRLDLTLAVCAFMAPAAQRATAARRVIDTHNIDSDVMRQYAERLGFTPRGLYARATAVRMAGLERRWFSEVDEVWVCADNERRELWRGGSPGSIAVVPNGVSAAHFAALTPQDSARCSLLFFGNLGYYPNEDAIEFLVSEILPRLRGMGVRPELSVVGRHASRRVRVVCSTSPDVTLHESVPDIRTVLGAHQIAVVPLRMGGGTRLKILEALAAGVAVVSTRIGAEGLPLESGRHALIADDPGSFAQGVFRLLQDDGLRRRLSLEGRLLVARLFDWDAIEGRIQGRVRELCGAGGEAAECS